MTHSPLRPGSVAAPAAATLLALACGTAGCGRVPPLQARKMAAGMQPGVRAEGGWRC